MKKIKSFPLIDMFATSPSIFYNGNRSQKTQLGKCVTLIVLSFLLFLIVLNFRAILKKDKSITVTSTSKGRDRGVPYGERFQVGISYISHTDGSIITDPTILSPLFSEILIQPTFSRRTLEYELCNTSHFSQNMSANGYCIKNNQNVTVGEYGKQIIYLQFLPCTNGTVPGLVCKPQAEIDRIFNEDSFVVEYPNYYYQPDNYNHPLDIRRGVRTFQSSVQLGKTISIGLRESLLKTDSGIMFESHQNQEYLEVQDLYSDAYMNNQKGIAVMISMTGDKLTNSRSYMKLQQSLAGILAILKVLVISFGFVLQPISKISYHQNFFNQIFNLKNKRESSIYDINKQVERRNYYTKEDMFKKSIANNSPLESPKALLTDSSTCSLSQRGEDANLINISEPIRKQSQFYPKKEDSQESAQYNTPADAQQIQIELKEDEKEGNVDPKNQHQELTNQASCEKGLEKQNNDKMGSNSLKSIFTCLKLKFTSRKETEGSAKQYLIGKQKISNYLCVVQLVSKMRELERLKMLLLTEEQRIIFDNLPKPNIEEKEVFKTQYQIAQDLDSSSEKANLKYYYNLLLRKAQKDFIDEQLLLWMRGSMENN